MPGDRIPWSGVGTLRAIHYTHMDSHMTVALPVTHIILGEEFDTDELRDIAEHGANTGVHGFTYSSDLHDMFDKYEEQSWTILMSIVRTTSHNQRVHTLPSS